MQQTLDEALQRALRLSEPAGLTVAGRTDAGVHARGQVAHVDIPLAVWQTAADRITRRLRGLLPDDVRVASVALAPPHFNARFAAIWRRYAYRVSDVPCGVDPLRRRDVLSHDRPLDLELMNLAASELEGEHDFASFCRKRLGASTVRNLRHFSWHREPNQIVVATVVADAFCHNMVRSLVGACMAVGESRCDVGWPATILARASRESSVNVVAARGLTLEEVAYPPEADMLRRIEQTRQLRGPAKDQP